MVYKEIKGYIIDILEKRIYPGCLTIENNYIKYITELAKDAVPEQYILPGFIDAHIHIESSMLVPSEFAYVAVQHGTVATVSDPHEIANVCGMDGVRYMINNAKQVPLKFHFGAPSCVPATAFETAGATINADDIKELLADEDIFYLAEMMNFPGVLYDDPDVMQKIAHAKAAGKPVDGHAPGLRGVNAKKYIRAGIDTDHECTTLSEALEKLDLGMKILIREGSAAKNFEALHPLFKTHPQQLMLCSDDKHPDDLLQSHINKLVIEAIRLGYPIFDVLYAACIHPILHYKMKVGYLQQGHFADFIIVDNLTRWNVTNTFINGEEVFANGKVFFERVPIPKINKFGRHQISVADIALPFEHKGFKEIKANVIEAIDGALVTNTTTARLKVHNGNILCNPFEDILKIVVINRYSNTPIAKGFIKNFQLKKGALASSVAHDSHNIVAVGVDDESLATVINEVIREEGGIAVFDGKESMVLPLPIAGLMSDKDAIEVGYAYERLNERAKALGTTLSAPFMTLSFMALPVIPFLKMTDKGLFDVSAFQYKPIMSNL